MLMGTGVGVKVEVKKPRHGIAAQPQQSHLFNTLPERGLRHTLELSRILDAVDDGLFTEPEIENLALSWGVKSVARNGQTSIQIRAADAIKTPHSPRAAGPAATVTLVTKAHLVPSFR